MKNKKQHEGTGKTQVKMLDIRKSKTLKSTSKILAELRYCASLQVLINDYVQGVAMQTDMSHRKMHGIFHFYYSVYWLQ